jgi:hypothetical protein
MSRRGSARPVHRLPKLTTGPWVAESLPAPIGPLSSPSAADPQASPGFRSTGSRFTARRKYIRDHSPFREITKLATRRSRTATRGPRAASREAGVSFTGSMGRAGNSRAFRVEAAFFKAAPEFAAAEKKIRVDLIGPGKALVSVDVEPAAGDDPVIGAWLSFLARDMRDNPQRMTSLSEAEATALEDLVKGVEVRDDETIPDDVTF